MPANARPARSSMPVIIASSRKCWPRCATFSIRRCGLRMPEPVVRSVETFIVSLPRDVPYLGPLGPGEAVNAKGYFVRRGNRTIYPSTDRSVVVKITASDGTVGWGETYG